MQYRHMSRQGSFSDWVNRKNEEANEKEECDEDDSLLSQISSIQDSFTSQFQELSGTLPDSGPLSAAFRSRMKYTIYLLLGSIMFAILAIVVGIPTIIIRPSKFVLCVTLSTLLAVASVVVMQKPSVFIENLLSAGFDRTASVVGLVVTSILTIYVTVFVKRYIVTMAATGFQILCILWFIASFIPGGKQGLGILLRTSYIFLKTVSSPMIYVCIKTVKAGISSLMS
jgi:hypothetical protein